jgi:hypothetical protein
MTAALEALLGLAGADLTFQLGSRVAWLLHPDNADGRIACFEVVKDTYNTRSKIAHGDVCKPDVIETHASAVRFLVMNVFQAILDTPSAWEALSSKDMQKAAGFLKELSLGKVTREKPADRSDPGKGQ